MVLLAVKGGRVALGSSGLGVAEDPADHGRDSRRAGKHLRHSMIHGGSVWQEMFHGSSVWCERVHVASCLESRTRISAPMLSAIHTDTSSAASPRHRRTRSTNRRTPALALGIPVRWPLFRRARHRNRPGRRGRCRAPAVYASRRALPHAMQASLPAGGLRRCRAGSRTRWIATRGFSSCHPPPQGLAWRNNRSA